MCIFVYAFLQEWIHTKTIADKNFSISTADEFIAAITQHIPEKSFQLVRYHGWYSNRMWG
ncbi:MAG: transposase, partial [Proteobacteria bacterium]|nr:transposase [Pseudomonadota bacterium]